MCDDFQEVTYHSCWSIRKSLRSESALYVMPAIVYCHTGFVQHCDANLCRCTMYHDCWFVVALLFERLDSAANEDLLHSRADNASARQLLCAILYSKWIYKRLHLLEDEASHQHVALLSKLFVVCRHSVLMTCLGCEYELDGLIPGGFTDDFVVSLSCQHLQIVEPSCPACQWIHM